MKQEDEELLIRDLCARVPYNTKGAVYGENIYEVDGISSDGIVSLSNYFPTGMCFVSNFKPYLFPMSSMTKEQKIEYFDSHWNHDIDVTVMFDHVDWLNKHHFDYRNLIGRGLAIDCTNLNIYD